MPRRDWSADEDWIVYLLIEPTPQPGNHPAGQAFFVGARRWRLRPTDRPTLELADLGSPTSPDLAEEPLVRDHLYWLQAVEVEPLVEVVAWHGPGVTEAVAQALQDALVLLLGPAVLNREPKRGSAVRFSGPAFDQLMKERPKVRLPAEDPALVYGVRVDPGLAGLAQAARLLEMGTAALLDEVSVLRTSYGAFDPGRTARSRAVAGRRADDDRVWFVVIASGWPNDGSRWVEPGLVLGVWALDTLAVVSARPTNPDHGLSVQRLKVVVEDDDTLTLAMRRYLTGGVLVDEAGVGYPTQSHGGEHWYPGRTD